MFCGYKKESSPNGWAAPALGTSTVHIWTEDSRLQGKFLRQEREYLGSSWE